MVFLRENNHKTICEPVGQINFRNDESYSPTELLKAQPSELPKGATFKKSKIYLPVNPPSKQTSI